MTYLNLKNKTDWKKHAKMLTMLSIDGGHG